MQGFPLNDNKSRKEFWDKLKTEVPVEVLKSALINLNPTTSQVLTLHYIEGYRLQEIVSMLGRSISVIRNHRNRGIFKLYQLF